MMKSIKKKKLVGFLCIVISLILVSATILIVKNSSQINIALLEQKFEKSEDEVDLINLFYALQNTTENEKKIYYTKLLIDKVTLEGIQNSKFKELFNESFSDKSPKDVIILFYFVNLLDKKDYDLISDEFSVYCTQTETFVALDTLIMKRYNKTGDEKIAQALIAGYENVYNSTTDELLKSTCVVHIDSIKMILNQNENISTTENSTVE